MDQDFHYYGTYQAASMSGWSDEESHLAAKAADFVDFLNEATYRGYWEIRKGDYIVGRFDAPRYTFQANFTGNVVGADGLWAAFHFLPGNYDDPPGTPASDRTHLQWVRGLLPNRDIPNGHLKRTVTAYRNHATLLTRPMSAASRYIIEDTVLLSKNSKNVNEILINAPAAYYLLPKGGDREAIIKKFIAILAGLRAHVICDTYAHQDWACIPSDINTYWGMTDPNSRGRNSSIMYLNRRSTEWETVTIKSTNLLSAPNLSGSPSILGDLGHGWMGHLPDYSFIIYKYRPAWDAGKNELIRRNPDECKYAFIEMLNMFQRMKSKNVSYNRETLELVEDVIAYPMDITAAQPFPRVHSAQKWIDAFHCPHPIDVRQESPPDPRVVLGDRNNPPAYRKHKGDPMGKTAYGTFTLDLNGNNIDMYLFMIAADYHFHFVRDWLIRKNIFTPNDSWSAAQGPLSFAIHDVIEKRFAAIERGDQ
jgi:hypothetical protein